MRAGTDRFHQNAKGRQAAAVILLMLALVAATRALCLTHNMYKHPDEHVFFLAADSLAHYWQGEAETYEEVKAYPEGAIVLQAPFHVAAHAAARAMHKTTDPWILGRFSGRVAAVCYFSLGAGLGALVLWRFLSRRRSALALYALTIVFSLMHLEQSRYGTGDAISFCLLMAIVLFSDLSLGEGKGQGAALTAAFFLSGVLCAVKYPLLLFVCIPAAAAGRVLKGKKAGGKALLILAAIVLTAAGFLLFSPKVLSEPHYLHKLLKSESLAYLTGGNICEVGGAANHLASLLVYLTLYACFPLSPVFLAAGWRRRGKACGSAPQDILFARVVPILMLVFFVYNLFPVTLFMRTYYPFFCLADLYVAAELAEWLAAGRGKRAAVLLLAALLTARGAFCVGAMTERQGAEKLKEMILAAPDENWKQTLILVNGFFLANPQDELTEPREIGIEDPIFEQDENLELQPGTLAITGTQEFSRCNHYFFPIDHEQAGEMIRRWDVFKRMNAPYYVGQAYPTAYYYLFGYWIKGTTGTDYEFPSNQVYYRR